MLLGELGERIREFKKTLEEIGEALRIEEKREEKNRLEKKMSQPGFWDTPEKAQQVVQKLQGVKSITTGYDELKRELEDLEALWELLLEEGEEAGEEVEKLKRDLREFEGKLSDLALKTYFTHPNDEKNAYFSIHPGSGGTESCDWAEMLYRMYRRWMERKGFQIEVIDFQSGEEAGIKRVTLHVKGPYAFGYLKSEIGVHRLVRISPFDANKKRHTSFAAVDVWPEMEDIEIEIREEDLRIDTFRSSGAGGQHVNVTDSAVRITHLPTGIVVQCQNERSQHKNKAMALKILKIRLYQLEEEKRQKERQELYGQKGEISWGNKIRSYVLQPYTLVKDHRTGFETANVSAILEGELDEIIEAYLKWDAARRAAPTG